METRRRPSAFQLPGERCKYLSAAALSPSRRSVRHRHAIARHSAWRSVFLPDQVAPGIWLQGRAKRPNLCPSPPLQFTKKSAFARCMRPELGDYPNISRRELPLLREELGASGADFCRGLIVALFCPKRRPFWDIGIAEQPRGPPSLSWGEERTKILLLACCYQEVAPAVASRDGDCGVERVAGRSGEVRQAGGPTSRLHAGHGAGAGGATVRRVPAATRKSPIGCGKVRTNRRGWLHL